MTSWHDVIDPIAARFEVAAAFGFDTVHNADSSKAIAKILRDMARIIDAEIDKQDAASQKFPPRPE